MRPAPARAGRKPKAMPIRLCVQRRSEYQQPSGKPDGEQDRVPHRSHCTPTPIDTIEARAIVPPAMRVKPTRGLSKTPGLSCAKGRSKPSASSIECLIPSIAGFAAENSKLLVSPSSLLLLQSVPVACHPERSVRHARGAKDLKSRSLRPSGAQDEVYRCGSSLLRRERFRARRHTKTRAMPASMTTAVQLATR